MARALEAGLPARPAAPRLEIRGREAKQGLTVERFAIDLGSSGSRSIEGVLILPDKAGPSSRVPVVILVGAPSGSAREAIDGAGLDGRPPGLAMAKFGFASLAMDANPGGSTHLRNLRIALDALLAQPEIDTGRIGVIGLGPAGPVALALMAVDERISCGVSAIETRDFSDLDALFGGGPSPRFSSFDPATFVDLLAALCAPRSLALYYGERLPLPSASAGKRLEGNIRRLYKLYGPEGNGLASTHFGEFDGHDSIATRLQWMGGLEQLDKHFRPQGPNPLGHATEPEPEARWNGLKPV